MKYMFFCDFDGTITREDVIDEVLKKFANPTWVEIEQSWVKGEIGSRDCLAMQTRLIKAKECELLDFAEGIPIDESFIDFAGYCKSQAIEIVILSDGIDLFIKSILNRYKLNDIKVFSNGLTSAADGFEITFPFSRNDCVSRSGLCKCKVMEEFSVPSKINLLVGDGRSDFCAAGRADLVFAKSDLLDFCRIEKIPHIEHNKFSGITGWLKDHAGKTATVSSGEIFRHYRRRSSNG